MFFTLHTLTILMKMHSYAFYNGHLSNTQQRLRALDNPGTADVAAAVRYPSSSTGLDDINAAAEKKKARVDEQNLTQLRTDLATELVSPLGSVTYPSNLSLANYADFICCPTLCYELEYPRTPKTQWMELFWKTLAVFGCIFLLTLTSEEFIVPVLRDSALRLQAIDSWFEMGLILAESISELLFPFMVTLLLVFLVIFEYVLGAFAEITCFADRHFYSDWWNSCDWYEDGQWCMMPADAGTGWNSRESGTYRSITSSDGMCMGRRGRTCHATWRHSSPSWSRHLVMSLSWAASPRSSEGMDLSPRCSSCPLWQSNGPEWFELGNCSM